MVKFYTRIKLTNNIHKRIKELLYLFQKEKLPQHWYEVKSSKVNISGDAKPVQFPCKLYKCESSTSA